MANKPGITQYIDLTDQTKEERLDEFTRTIDLALDSLARKKDGVQSFTDIVVVACNKIMDIFDVNEIFEIRLSQGDCVRTSAYLPKDEEGFYFLFVEAVDLVLAKENLCENLQPKGFVLVKKNK